MNSRKIRKGITYRFSRSFEQSVFSYKTISNISNTAPVQITCEGHDLPENWRFLVSGVKGGGSQLNCKNPSKPKTSEYHISTVIDADTIEINNISALDWLDYESGGVIKYAIPYDFTDCTAKLQIRETIDSSVLIELTTENDGIEIDAESGTLYFTIPSSTTDILATESYFDAEIYYQDGTVMLAMPIEKIVWIEEITKDD